MQKSPRNGCQEQTSGVTFGDLLTSYASALMALSLACNRLQLATLRLASPKSPPRLWSVSCGRPVSRSLSTDGRRLRVVGKSARLTLVK